MKACDKCGKFMYDSNNLQIEYISKFSGLKMTYKIELCIDCMRGMRELINKEMESGVINDTSIYKESITDIKK